MAQKPHSHSTATLRAISYRITSTPTEQLPLLASQLCGSIWTCKDTLSTPADTLKANAEVSSLVHRYKTSLSSLLQDRTVEGRWAAVALTKATIEAGGVEILSKSNNWVRSLLAILKKPDPATTRILAIITLSRIYSLTWEYSNLVREITTPSLPGFISTCLTNASKKSCSANELQTILEAFVKLLPRHPTIFRTHETQIRQLLLRILSSGSSTIELQPFYSDQLKRHAQRLLVLLHYCAPKQGGSELWDNTFQAAVVAAHETCGCLFRSVIETWQPANHPDKSLSRPDLTSSEPELQTEDPLGMGPWQGMVGGRSRLITVLGILRSHLEITSSATVPVRVGLLFDLLTRLLTLTVPRDMETVNTNAQVSKAEREQLFAVLPTIHVAAIGVVNSLLVRFGQGSVSFTQLLMECMVDVYRAESFHREVRELVYCCMEHMLHLSGPSLPKESIVDISPVLKGCCDDLLPVDASRHSANTGLQQSQTGSKDLALRPANPAPQAREPTVSTLTSSASHLLATTITKIDPSHLSRKLRTQIERTAVLAVDKEVLLACVMNPARKEPGGKLQTSLLPLLAKQHPNAVEVEALVRPRMPPVVLQTKGEGEDDLENDQEPESRNGFLQEMVEDRPEQQKIDMGGNTDVDPTAALFDALTRTENLTPDHRMDDDLDTSKPVQIQDEHQHPAELALHQSHSTSTTAKRPAHEASPEVQTSRKRLRAFPVAEARIEDPLSVPAGPDSGNGAGGVPITVAASQDTSERTAQTAVTTDLVSNPTAVNDDVASDLSSGDSDFEMPPLTMDPDTDPEDEDEDESEGR